MNITADKLQQVWYAREDGATMAPILDEPEMVAAGYTYRHFEDPGTVTETCYHLDRDPMLGMQGREVFTARSTYSDDTATAMVRSGRWSVHQAALILARACSRCMNALAYEYQAGQHGYPEDSEEYRASRTRCQFCDPTMEVLK